MSVLTVIEEAIRSRSPVAFQYLRLGKTPGIRVANPHVVFIRRLKSGEEKVYVHMWQTDGVTDSNKPLPDWREFVLSDISGPQMRPDGVPFEIAEGYNPSFYSYPIAKI